MKEIRAQQVDPKQLSLALVISEFNTPVTQKLYEGAIAQLQELGVTEQQCTAVFVPGAVEIPLVAQRLAQSQRYQAIICLGAVIRGETSHYDYVCEQVSQGTQRVALDQDLPVIFGVLTTENAEQAYARVGGGKKHLGRDAAKAAMEMISVLQQITSIH